MHYLFIISGPVGVGKTAVAKALIKKFPELHTSVTYTTRPPRDYTTEDKKIFYVSKEEFTKRKNNEEFLEWAVVHNDFYGTHKEETLKVLDQYPILFNIDVQGAEQLKKSFPDKTITIFLMPESKEQLLAHIQKRGGMDEDAVQTRLKTAEFELSRKDLFDYQIINKEGKMEETVDKIATLIQPHL